MKKAKRLFDIFWTSLGLLLLWPVFLVIALLIKIDDGGPVFYRQVRVGRGGKPFRIWKFRTMVVNADKIGGALTVGKDPRITRVGYWLRKLKLDELPQLFNVLSGEMSLVGPRPEVPEYVSCYSQEQKQVLKLTPGITDPASIAYRNESEILASADDPETVYISKIMPEKIKLNLHYAENSSLWSDFLIIIKTILRLFGQ